MGSTRNGTETTVVAFSSFLPSRFEIIHRVAGDLRVPSVAVEEGECIKTSFFFGLGLVQH
jgi:hypothetical protein